MTQSMLAAVIMSIAAPSKRRWVGQRHLYGRKDLGV